MNRRTFIATSALAVLAAPLAAEAQEARKIPRVGIMPSPEAMEAYRQGYRDLGYR